MGMFMCKSMNHQKADESAFMMRNQKLSSENLIASSNGKYNPIQIFSVEELERATDNYHHQNIITESSFFRLFRGVLLDHPVSVMRFFDNQCLDAYTCCFKNLVFESQMNHNNVLKLIGYCLELEIPVLVFESVEYGTLHDLLKKLSHHQSDFKPLLLKQKLKIAMEIASVIAYLHIGLSRPTVFRDLTSSHILFCKEYVPKLFNFSLSEFIPEGKTFLDDGVKGTSAIAAPEYVTTGYCNEKCDVFNFGILLLQLLSTEEDMFTLARHLNINGGEVSCTDSLKKYNTNHGFNGMMDPRIVGDDEFSEQQLRFSLELVFKCLSYSAEDRPSMKEVEEQLRQMYQSAT